MLIGCCVNMLPKESSDAGAWYAPEIKAAGYDYLELPIGQVAGQSNVEFEEMRSYLKEVSLPVYACNNFFPPTSSWWEIRWTPPRCAPFTSAPWSGPLVSAPGMWCSAVPGPNPARKDFPGTGRSINWHSGAVRSGTRPASGVL